MADLHQSSPPPTLSVKLEGERQFIEVLGQSHITQTACSLGFYIHIHICPARHYSDSRIYTSPCLAFTKFLSTVFMAYIYYAPANPPVNYPARPPTYTLALSQSRAPCGTITPPAIDLALHHHPRLCEETLCKSSHLKCPPSTSTVALGLAPTSPSQGMSPSPPLTRTATPTMTPCTRQNAAWSAIMLHNHTSGAIMPQVYPRPLEERRRGSLKDSVMDRVRWFKRGVKGIFVRKSMRL